MISVSCKGQSGYEGKIGLDHFIRTYGLILGRDSPVGLAYGGDRTGKFNVIVNEGSGDRAFEDMVQCALKISDSLPELKKVNSFPDLSFISADEDSVTVSLDVFSFVGRCLSGELERFWKNAPEREKTGKVPLIDACERMLFSILLYGCGKLRLPFVCKSLWPGKRFAVCLTHDVDEVRKTYQWLTRPVAYLKKGQAGLLKGQLLSLWHRLQGEEPFWTFESIMELEERLGVRSSFYFLKEKGKADILSPDTWKLLGRRYDFNDPQVKGVMKKLCDGGWEVGLHGSYDSYRDFEMLEGEKKMLQESLGNKVTGIRQHHLNLKLPETWEYHDRAGLKYDTTLGFKDRMGFRGGTCLPFHPVSGQEMLNLLEIPLAIMDTPLFGYRKDRLHADFEGMVDAVSGFGGVLTLLWHHAVFNEHEYPGWGTAYGRLIELCRRRNAWITCGKELADWWIWREKADFGLEHEGDCLMITPHRRGDRYFLSVYLPEGMRPKNILHAEVVDTCKGMHTIRTDKLKHDERIKIEFVEMGYGNRSKNSRRQ
ncbi:MAG: polysaccharide deacetylase family protein [Candidatus Methanoperedens sp.]|nr:polysaccharide deacetylase family protein [Candidatus Methanoperedens sp.]